jgi:hypothetical protein
MSLNRCPHCNNPLTADERRGRTCPACGKPLAVGGAPGAAPEGGWSAVGSPSAPGPASSAILGWGTTRAGLGILGAGLIFIALAFAGTVILFGALKQQKNDPEMMMVFALVGYALIGGVVFSLAGVLMLGAAPSESGAKPWAIVTIISALVIGVVALLSAYGVLKNQEWESQKGPQKRDVRIQAGKVKDDKDQADSPPFSDTVLTVLAYTFKGAIFLVGFFLSMFLWRVSRHLRRYGLAAGILAYVVLAALFALAVLFALPIIAAGEPKLAEILASNEVIWGMHGGWLVVILWQLLNVLMVRSTITKAILGRSP